MTQIADAPKDQTMPEGGWKFDGDVTAVFDDMLARSIPQYEVMRTAVQNLALRYRQEKTDLVDLGCSRGEAIAPLVERFGAHNRYCLVEVSDPMLDVVRTRFKGWVDNGLMRILKTDLRYEYPGVMASVTLCILTLQFTPIEYRQRILRDIYKSTVPGGALILVEKVLGSTAEMDRTMVDLYYKLKKDNGYTQDQIDRKRFSLEGVLVPVTAKWNEELLRMAGFTQVDGFWRWMNFAGWIAVKE